MNVGDHRGVKARKYAARQIAEFVQHCYGLIGSLDRIFAWLDFHVKQHVRICLQQGAQLLQRRNVEARKFRAKPTACVKALQFLHGIITYRAGPVGSPLQCTVMDHHKHIVLGQMQIKLDHINIQIQRLLK
ncbi:hypothetical protein D3C76_1335200 [compost metagenome]